MSFIDTNNLVSYEIFLAKSRHHNFYTSTSFLKFLEAIGLGQPYYFTTNGADHLPSGVLPFFGYYNETFGLVMNSLPWYGSYGGCNVNVDVDEDMVRQELVTQLVEFIGLEDVALASISLSPYESMFSNVYLSYLQSSTLVRKRTQETLLYTLDDDWKLGLFNSFEKRTQAAIVKGQNSGFTIENKVSKDDLVLYHSMHLADMISKGGLAKDLNHVSEMLSVFPEKNLKIFNAKYDGEPAALLLVILFGDTAEYILPIVHPSYKSKQVLSLLIWEAMLEAVKGGCKVWNWGGTGWHQESLHRFKRGWGSTDKIYHRITYVKPSKEEEIRAIMSRGPSFSLNPYYYHLDWKSLGSR